MSNLGCFKAANFIARRTRKDKMRLHLRNEIITNSCRKVKSFGWNRKDTFSSFSSLLHFHKCKYFGQTYHYQSAACSHIVSLPKTMANFTYEFNFSSVDRSFRSTVFSFPNSFSFAVLVEIQQLRFSCGLAILPSEK